MTTRNCCYTIFQDKIDFNLVDHLNECYNNGSIKYSIVQLEKSPETGALHFQGYIEMPKPMRFGAIKKLLKCESAHLEARKGTPQQAADYCRKEDSRFDGPWELGELTKQGQRYVTLLLLRSCG